MDTSSLVHDFPAVLCVVFGAVFDRQDVMRLDVCGILFTRELRVLYNLRGAVLRGVLPSRIFPVSNGCSIILCVISVCLIQCRYTGRTSARGEKVLIVGQCQTVTRD